MKRVLLLSPTAAPGGAERAFISLAKNLPQYGWQPCVILLERGGLEDWLSEAEVPYEVVIAGRFRQAWNFASTIRALYTRIREADIQAVFSNQTKGHLYGGTAAALAGVPNVWWQHIMPSSSLMERLAQAIPTARVVCGSQAVTEAQLQVAPRVATERIYYGIDIATVADHAGSGAAVRTRMRWDNATVIGCVGRLQPWKGQDVFLRAAADVATDHPDLRFALVGGAVLGWEGDYPQQLEQLAADLGIAESVSFLGHQADPYPWFDALDIVVHASHGEPFGLVLLEAMALSKPLIATAAGGPIEILAESGGGVLVPPGDSVRMAAALRYILDNASGRADLQRAARERVEMFSEGRMVAGVGALLDEVLAASHATPGRLSRPSAHSEELHADAMAGHGTHDAVSQLLDPPRGGWVLDVGAGQGAFSQRMRESGHRVIAAGIAGGQFMADGIPYVSLDADTRLPFRAASFEGIVAIELIEHLEGPLLFIRRAVELLAPGGWLALTTPNTTSIASKVSVVIRGHPIYFGDHEYRTNGHISPVSLLQVHRIAERVGLVVEHVTYNIGKLPIPKLRHRAPLRGQVFLTQSWGECLVVLLRKRGVPIRDIVRG